MVFSGWQRYLGNAFLHPKFLSWKKYIAVATRKPIIAAGLPFYSTFTLGLSDQSGDLLARITRHFH
jgi:hypothetical protein